MPVLGLLALGGRAIHRGMFVRVARVVLLTSVGLWAGCANQDGRPQVPAPSPAPNASTNPSSPGPGTPSPVGSEQRQLEAFFEGMERQGEDTVPGSEAMADAHEWLEVLRQDQPCIPATLELEGALVSMGCRQRGALSSGRECPELVDYLGELGRCQAWSPGPLEAVGDRLIAAGQVRAAVGWYGVLLYKRTDRAHWGLLVATALFDAGRHSEVLEFMDSLPRELLEEGSFETHQLLYQAGLSAQAAGEPEQAEAWFLRAAALLERVKGLDEAVMAACPYQALGSLYREQGRNDESLEMYLASARREPNHAYAQHLVAEHALELGRYDLALEYAERSLALQPDAQSQALKRNIEAKLLGQLGGSDGITRAGALEAAVEAFDAYAFVRADAIARLALDRLDSPRLVVVRALSALMKAEHDLCAALLADLQEENADLPSLSVAQAHLAIALGDEAGAQVHLEHALGLMEGEAAPTPFASQPPAWRATIRRLAQLAQGWQASNRAEHALAIESFDAILATTPDDRFALLGKGNSANALGLLDQASVVFERVLVLDPGNQYALAELGLVAYNRGDDQGAERYLLEALEADPVRYTCPHEGLGMVYLRQGDTQRAREHFERAIEISPDIEYRKYNGLARIYIEDGRYDEARGLLEKSIQNHPHDPQASRMLEELDQHQGTAN